MAIANAGEGALAEYGVEVGRIPGHERPALQQLAARRDAAWLGRGGLTPQGDSMSEAAWNSQ